MSEVTQILSGIEAGDPHAAEQLLPLVYDELRKLAAQKLAQEKPGQTLDATALVHEAYLRLVGTEKDQRWDSRGHFFAAAAEAMRRILVENARRKKRSKHGGDCQRDLADGLSLGGDQEFKDKPPSTHEFELVLKSKNVTLKDINLPTYNIHIQPNGRDRWIFDVTITLEFDDGSSFSSVKRGIILDQDNKDYSGVFESN
jgi:hypothetical protein